MHRGFGLVPGERTATMSKEARTYLESKFVAAKGKPDYSQLSQDLLDKYGIERSVQQLKKWWTNNTRRLRPVIAISGRLDL